MKGDISVEYPFIFVLVIFGSVLTYLVSLGLPLFSVNSIGSLPDSPTHWYQYPSYLLNMMVFFFKLLITPSVPSELRFLSVLIFTPFSILLAWLIIKFIAPLIASVIPF